MIITRKWTIPILVVIALSWLVGAVLYSQLPEMVASHWNVRGEADDFTPKFWGVFLLPLITLGTFLLLGFLPKIDPFRKNVEQFRDIYGGFLFVVVLFLTYLYVLTLLWNLGSRFDMIQLLVPALAALFYATGVMIRNAKRNWFIGIRTPWTLSNETVWERTHQMGGRLFKLAALVMLLGVFFPGYALFFVMVPLLGAALYAVVYSYFAYQAVTR
jgi:uncharacterized membrane protein